MGLCDYCATNSAGFEISDDDADMGCSMVCAACHPGREYILNNHPQLLKECIQNLDNQKQREDKYYDEKENPPPASPEFMLCESCAAKTGTPTLCQPCYNNRCLIGQLERQVEKFQQPTVSADAPKPDRFFWLKIPGDYPEEEFKAIIKVLNQYGYTAVAEALEKRILLPGNYLHPGGCNCIECLNNPIPVPTGFGR